MFSVLGGGQVLDLRAEEGWPCKISADPLQHEYST